MFTAAIWMPQPKRNPMTWTPTGIMITTAGMNRDPRILLIGSWVLVAMTHVVGAVLGPSLPSLHAVGLLLCVYWAGCWTIVLFDAPAASRMSLFRPARLLRPGQVIVTWLPAVAVGVIVFLPEVSSMYPMAVAGAAVVATINAITEETLWRGAFVERFPERLQLGLLFPLVPFAMWHLALVPIPIDYGPGGAVGLVGGAAVLGLIWGWVVWRTRSLRLVIPAHAVTNFFGFAAIGVSNWPAP